MCEPGTSNASTNADGNEKVDPVPVPLSDHPPDVPDEDAVEVVGRLVRGQPGGVVVLVGPNVVRVLRDLDRKERYLLHYFSNFASNWILPLITVLSFGVGQ